MRMRRARVRIRQANPVEAEALSDLATRSKAYWGYDAAFMERVADMLEVSADYISSSSVFVAERAGEVVGFYGFRDVGGDIHLNDLWIAPEHIRTGIGVQLWEHAVRQAEEMGLATFLIASDPNAEGFYLRMGSHRVGEIDGGAGRMIPLLRYDVAPLTN